MMTNPCLLAVESWLYSDPIDLTRAESGDHFPSAFLAASLICRLKLKFAKLHRHGTTKHLSANVNICMHLCVYVHPTEGSDKEAFLPLLLSDCSNARALLLPLHVGFGFFLLVLLLLLNTHRLQGLESRWKGGGGVRKNQGIQEQHINVDFTRVVGYSLETYL